jgi:hypothetical protein
MRSSCHLERSIPKSEANRYAQSKDPYLYHSPSQTLPGSILYQIHKSVTDLGIVIGFWVAQRFSAAINLIESVGL